jgi:hypothetical protein
MSSGIFHILAEYERIKAQEAGHEGQNPFRDVFGELYKKYVGLQLAQGPGKEELVDLDQISYQGNRPDFALIKGKYMVLFEVKVGLVTTLAKLLSDEARLKVEIQRPDGQFCRALNQLNEFETAIKEGRVDDRRLRNKKIIKVVVAYEDFYFANSHLLGLAKEVLDPCIISNVQIMTLMDVDTCGTALANKGGVVKYLFEKMEDEEFRQWSVSMFLRDKNRGIRNINPLLRDAFREFFHEYSGGKIPPKELEYGGLWGPEDILERLHLWCSRNWSGLLDLAQVIKKRVMKPVFRLKRYIPTNLETRSF